MRYLLLLSIITLSTVTASANDIPPESKIAVDRLAKYESVDPVPSKDKLVFVYFTPADRTPPEGYRKRLARVMLNIQKFYADEMERNGLGRRTVKFDLDADGGLTLVDVKGKLPASEYLEERGSSSKGGLIARESQPALRAAGVNNAESTIIYFCDLRTEKDGKVTGIGPYYGSGPFSGSFGNGRCWFTDATIMDADKLSDKTTMLRDQQYGHISVGKYNSIFMGGAAHELGHALGLPHDKQQKSVGDIFGTSLMGSGNRTYHDELRGQDKGSFLTLGDALRLASHPMFCGSETGIHDPLKCQIEDLHAQVRDGGLDLTGRIIASPQPYAVIVYNDPYSGSDYYNGNFRDYDSTTWTGVLDASDHFKIHIGEFKPGGAKLRLVVCHVNGGSNVFEYPLSVDADGTPDATTFTVPVVLHDAIAAWDRGDTNTAKMLAGTVTDSSAKKWADALVSICNPEPDYPAIADVTGKEVSLSHVKWDEAKVGWGDPTRNHFPVRVGPFPFFSLGGKYYVDGLYAHAPSKYVFNLGDGTRFKSFTAVVGMQASATGAADFVVNADGKEIFRSKPVRDTSTVDVNISIAGAKTLELIAEEVGGDNRLAWAVWGDPKISENPPVTPELLQKSGRRP
jgi:hypothetical protein